MNTETLKKRIRVARGEEPADFVLTGGQVVNVFTNTIEPGNIAIVDGCIAGVGPWAFRARDELDIDGACVAPGLIDAHIHIESTLLMPAELARLVVPHGTTALIADPHEIANVLGIPGVEMMIAASAGLPLECFFMAPSCVPASPFERAGAELDAEAIAQLMQHDRVLGLAEMMNFPGVLHGDPAVLAKLASAQTDGRPIDGHSPGLVARDLMAYAAAGIRSDHECVTTEEAVQRAALGMLVQVREGSAARNLDALLPLIVEGRLPTWCLCTDDIHPDDLVERGHLDHLLRRVVEAGVEPATAIRHASYLPAQHYGLCDRGAVAPGYRADLVVFDDTRNFAAQVVIKDGAVVAQGGVYQFDGSAKSIEPMNTINIPDLPPDVFTLRVDESPQPVIGVVPDQIVTRHEQREVNVVDGVWRFDPEHDIALIACVQRHDGSGQFGLGLVSGFGFTSCGALASSVGHDAHNVLVTGTHSEEMATAVGALGEMGGGFVVVRDGTVIGRMALPVAGLMSRDDAASAVAQQEAVRQAAHALGSPLHSPFGALSFLALSVIPSLRITDQGLFDVEQFQLLG